MTPKRKAAERWAERERDIRELTAFRALDAATQSKVLDALRAAFLAGWAAAKRDGKKKGKGK